MGAARQLALERLGSLRNGRRAPETLERLQAYHERQVAKNSTGRLSRRRLDAFLGLCAVQEDNRDTNVLLEELKEVIARWPDLGTATSESFSQDELKHVGRSVCTAIFHMNDVPAILKLSSFLFDRIDFAGKLKFVKILTITDDSLKPELVVLVGLLEVAAQHALKVSFSDFVLLTQALNDHISRAFEGVSKRDSVSAEAPEQGARPLIFDLQSQLVASFKE